MPDMKKILIWICIFSSLFMACTAYADTISFIDDTLYDFELGQFSIAVPDSWELTKLDECTYTFFGEEIHPSESGYGFLIVTIENDIYTGGLPLDELIVSSFSGNGFSDFVTDNVIINGSEATLFDCLREDGIQFSGSWIYDENSLFMIFYTDSTSNVEAIHKKAEEFSSTIRVYHDISQSQDAEYTNAPNFSSNDTTKPIIDCSEIDVRFEKNYIDGDDMFLKVFVQNTSEKSFTGNVYVTFYTNNSKRLGSDTIIVEGLLPGRESWANVVIDAYADIPQMTVDFSNVSFESVEVVHTEIDTNATEKTKKSFYWNFDGVNWYNDVTNITVYTDGSCVVTVKNPKESGQFYASTIWSCGKQYGVTSVQVVDSNGKVLAVY